MRKTIVIYQQLLQRTKNISGCGFGEILVETRLVLNIFDGQYKRIYPHLYVCMCDREKDKRDKEQSITIHLQLYANIAIEVRERIL